MTIQYSRRAIQRAKLVAKGYHAIKLLNDDRDAKAIASELGVSRATVYRAVRAAYEDHANTPLAKAAPQAIDPLLL